MIDFIGGRRSAAQLRLLLISLLLSGCQSLLATPTPTPTATPTNTPTPIPSPTPLDPTPLPSDMVGVRLSMPWHKQEHSLSCEAASLLMVFRYFGLGGTENDLIEEIGLDDTPLQRTEEGEIIWGDPNEAFVGNIDGWQIFLGGYTSHPLQEWGYGVYLDPLIRVARTHGLLAATIPDVESIYEHIDRGWPSIVVVPYGGRVEGIVWEWYTPGGKPIRVMNRQHTVVVYGYDDKFVYVRDPAGKMTYYSRSDFEGAWANLRMAAVFGKP